MGCRRPIGEITLLIFLQIHFPVCVLSTVPFFWWFVVWIPSDSSINPIQDETSHASLVPVMDGSSKDGHIHWHHTWDSQHMFLCDGFQVINLWMIIMRMMIVVMMMSEYCVSCQVSLLSWFAEFQNGIMKSSFYATWWLLKEHVLQKIYCGTSIGHNTEGFQ